MPRPPHAAIVDSERKRKNRTPWESLCGVLMFPSTGSLTELAPGVLFFDPLHKIPH
jgi:hypothetical protein